MATATDFRIWPESAGFDFPFSLIQRVWDELATPYEPDDRLAELTPGQRAMYSLYWINAEVCNGGFDQCFTNSTGYLMPEAIEGARLFDGPEWIGVLSNAAAALGEPFPRDREERNRRLDSLSRAQQSILEDCDNHLYALDATYEGRLPIGSPAGRPVRRRQPPATFGDRDIGRCPLAVALR